jgi:hypothetical protein
MLKWPISPSTNNEGRIFGTMARTDKENDLKTNKNMMKIIRKTAEMVLICESKRL